jgi:hypothetical protein
LFVDGATLGSTAITGRKFRTEPPANHDVTLLVGLHWCSSGAFPALIEPEQRLEAKITLTLHRVEIANVTVDKYNWDLASQDSFATKDGRCFHMSGHSVPIDIPTPFSGHGLSIHFELGAPTRRQALNFTASYAPVAVGSGLVLQYTPISTAAALKTDPGVRIRADDHFPPRITGCPTDILVILERGKLELSVNWIEPIATDNVQVVSFVRSKAPGTFFSVLGSPHSVTYEATDSSGLKATCSFHIFVDFERQPVQASLLVDDTIRTDFWDTGIGLTIFSDAYAGLESLEPEMATWTAREANATVVEVVILDAARNTFALRPSDASELIDCRFEIDLRFSINSTQPLAGFGSSTTFTSVEFINITDIDGAPLPSFPPLKWFESNPSLTTFEPGRYMRLAGSTQSNTTAFRFAGIRASLNLPANLCSILSMQDLSLEAGSFARFMYVYDDPPGAASPNASARAGFLKVYDDIPPVIAGCSGHIHTNTAPGKDYAIVSWNEPVITDNRNDTHVISSARPSDLFKIGSTRVLYTAHDAYGNEADCAFNVTVVDSELPQLKCPQSKIVNVSAFSNQAVLDANDVLANASDNSGSVLTTNTPAGRSFSIGTHLVIAQASDPSGNSAICTFTLTVTDPYPPQFLNCPSDSIHLTTSDANGLVVEFNELKATDNDGLLVIVTGSHAPHGTLFKVGSTVVQYKATDSSGNEQVCIFTVVVELSKSSTSNSSNSGLSQEVSVVIILIVLIALLMVVAILVIWVRRQRSSKTAHNFESQVLALGDLNTPDGPRLPREIQRRCIRLLETIGSGNYGSVTKGLLSEHSGSPGYLVAVKSLLRPDTASHQLMLREAAIMAQFNHERIVGLVGVVTVGVPMLVIMEFCEHGSLLAMLRESDTAIHVKFMLSADCAEGLAYLENLRFVHRDIAARNILLSSERRAKIGDFGMSREIHDAEYYHATTGGAVAVRWAAPEALEQHKFSPQSDCWSYGVLVR